MSADDRTLREFLCVLLRLFYAKDWVSGTGGGICARTKEGTLLVAPTGVHKELVEPDDLFVIDPLTCAVLEPASNPSLHPSECSSIFAGIVQAKGAGSVVHSHALGSVLAADCASGDALQMRQLEMLKGIQGVTNSETHSIAVIQNTARESELTSAVRRACDDQRFEKSAAILVRDHGAYIWGKDLMEAKRHAEVYHFLFEATRLRRSSQS